MSLNTKDINNLKAAFFDQADILFSLWDKDLICIDVNEATLKAINFKRENFVGKHVTEISPDNVSSGRYEQYKEVLRTGKTLVIDEMKVHPSLGNFYARIKVFKMGDGLGIVTKDITDLKQSIEKLTKAETEIRNFARHINKVLEDERAHIAREIHDDIGQQLAGIKMGLALLKKALFNSPEVGKLAHATLPLSGGDGGGPGALDGMMKNVDDTIQSLRKIATELRPGILDSLGLIPSIKWLAQEFEKKTGIKCFIEAEAKEQMFEKNLSTCFFRICQESLTNISKHAEASEIKIKTFQNDRELLLEISDNGKGISSEKLDNPFSMGLLGMRERANIIGGELQIKSQKNMGTTIQLKAHVN